MKPDTQPAPAAHSFDAGPVAWQKFGDWCLTGQYGKRPIILSVMRGKLALRDAKTDRLVLFTPDHPDAVHIVEALNSHTTLTARAATADRLAEAIKPLAGLDIVHHEDRPDSHPVYGLNSTLITLGDVRAARSALAAAKGTAP